MTKLKTTAGQAAPGRSEAGGTSLQETAWAKVNLTLQVTGRRADGYHELASLVVFADCGDRLTFAPSDELSLTLQGPFAGSLPATADNLVLRAARGIAELTGRPLPCAITLTKTLPVAAGIGGGSADAAAVLRALCPRAGLSLEDSGLRDLALALGADVPVCLASQPTLLSGIGERLEPLAGLPPLALVLANPGSPLSTAEVFKARQGPFGQVAAQAPPTATEAFLEWLAERPNDLEAAARSVYPEVARVVESLAATEGCRLARMSGSGATCFGLYESRAEAERAAFSLAEREPKWWVKAAGLRL
ncbi:4-(cytidine 5'-diphospho)-2-C-methyl-D-erythritol kinase [Pelagibius sp.]|uniref:4-(cytidine 5'-diphospho)-2-C-methyl-D-erythritol kinase n=1 Tax=Pelagibius sp. TaxID=1931238 RepID=UPI002AC34798|nr:4-(cytidine 5'-diphospho)-2-C-methyl-D-erythritol kinase [Pelagibius sp.]